MILPKEWQPPVTTGLVDGRVPRPELVDGRIPFLKNSSHRNPQVKRGEMAMSVTKTNIDLPGTDLAWSMGETLPEEWQPLEDPRESRFNGDIWRDVNNV